MSDIKIIKWANNLGITEAVNGSWIEAIARHYGATDNNGPWISVIAEITNNGAISTDFIMTIDTTKVGSASDSFNLRIGTTGAIPNTGTVYWGDGTSDLCSSFGGTGITHVYPSSGVYDVTIVGQFQGIRYVGAGDFNKLIEVKQWGSSLFEFINFSNTSNLTITATDIPNTSNVTSFASSFASSAITTIPNINQWDWSNITSCQTMFYQATSLLTLDLSGIDLSSCTNFGISTTSGMFIDILSMFRNRNKEIIMSQIDYHPNYQSSSDGTRYLTINEQGRGDVVQHSHSDSGMVHLHNEITTSQSYMLVDLSDTVNYHHNYSNYIHLENLTVHIDADNQSDYTVTIGYLKNVNSSGGTFVHLYSIGGDRVAGRSQHLDWNPYPNGPRLINGYVVTNDTITSSDYSNTNSLPSTLGVNINPSDGDVIVRVVRNAGTFDLSINMTYHSH